MKTDTPNIPKGSGVQPPDGSTEQRMRSMGHERTPARCASCNHATVDMPDGNRVRRTQPGRWCKLGDFFTLKSSVCDKWKSGSETLE